MQQRTAAILYLLFIALLAAAPVLALGRVPPGLNPCANDLALEAPTVNLEFQRPSQDRILVKHDGGDSITGENTQSVTVYVTDSEIGTTSKQVWLNESTGLQMRKGDTRWIHDKDFSQNFSQGDQIRIVWRGEGEPDPFFCELETHTLGLYTIGDGKEDN